MDKELIEKYSAELMRMYKSANASIPVVTDTRQEALPEENNTQSVGKLIVNVTSLRGLYPVSGASVTVFSGPFEQREEIQTLTTDESGRTKPFVLEAPAKYLSESISDSNEIPYAQYNILIRADGFVDQINMNVPVFSGVTSLQDADLMLISAAGNRTQPRVFDEARNYNL